MAILHAVGDLLAVVNSLKKMKKQIDANLLCRPTTQPRKGKNDGQHNNQQDDRAGKGQSWITACTGLVVRGKSKSTRRRRDCPRIGVNQGGGIEHQRCFRHGLDPAKQS